MTTATETSPTISTAKSNFMWDMATSHRPQSENLQDVDMEWWNRINEDCGDFSFDQSFNDY